MKIIKVLGKEKGKFKLFSLPDSGKKLFSLGIIKFYYQATRCSLPN
jgi:hypothetical protein